MHILPALLNWFKLVYGHYAQHTFDFCPTGQEGIECTKDKEQLRVLKFIYSEKVTKFYEISTADLTVTIQDKSTMEISQKFVAFSEYMNFTV